MDKERSSPLVFIIVLNWNGWTDTLECLESLRQLDYPNFRMVVVDNGSTNHSTARIEQAHPSIEVLQSSKNLGFAGGNNVGIRHALERGADYVWLLNNDTVVEPNALRAMVDLTSKDPDIGAVGSALYYLDRPDKIQAYGGGWVSLKIGMSRHFTAPVPDDRLSYVAGTSLLIQRDTLESIGLLDDGFFMYWEDADYGLRARMAGWRLAVAPESRIWHKESAALGTKSLVLDGYFNASAVRFFKKHSSLPILPISIGVGGRLLKRVAARDWQRASTVCKAAFAAWRQE